VIYQSKREDASTSNCAAGTRQVRLLRLLHVAGFALHEKGFQSNIFKVLPSHFYHAAFSAVA